ncbi:MAG: hypothetical protein R3C62_09910 [Chloroflexota bacterium]
MSVASAPSRPCVAPKRPFSATARARRPGEKAIYIASFSPDHPAPTTRFG